MPSSIPSPPTTGNGRLSSVDNVLFGLNDVNLAYTYDELGRVVGQVTHVTGSNEHDNTSSVTYDTLGRISVVNNTLGSFTNVYVGATPLLATNLYPNGQMTAYSYLGLTNDERLARIANFGVGRTNLSTFNYTYDAQGNIQSWTQQADANMPQVYSYNYDRADQLISAVLQTTGNSPAVLKQFAYLYDMAGNRTSEQIGGSSPSQTSLNSSSFNNLNQKISESPGGTMQVQGSLNGTANVTVNGNAATVSTNLTFTGYASNIVASVSGTSNSISVSATYSSGTATNQYGVFVTGTTNQVLAYDADGELTNDGAGRTFQWENGELTSVTQGGVETDYYYDGLGHRIAEVGPGTFANYYLWSGSELCEQYTASIGLLARTKRFYPQGETISFNEDYYSPTPYYYTRDHLGSVREVTDGTGTIQARYDYDPYGRKTLVQGADFSDFGYAGMYFDQPSGLNLTLFRAYDSNAGRWLSRDPIQELGGVDLYSYVGNDPLNRLDWSGLSDAGTVWVNGTKVTGINTSQDFFNAITQNSNGDGSITSLVYSGHGDTRGGLFMPNQPGQDLEGWEVANWLKTNSKLFAKDATIKFKACGSANPNKDYKGHRVVDAFKNALPDSHVWGFTGLDLGLGPLGDIGVPNNGVFGKHGEDPNVPYKSAWVEVK